MKNKWIFESALKMAAEIRNGNVTSEEIVTQHIQQIITHNSKTNAIVTLVVDEALKNAKLADMQVKEGSKLGPLHGVPITIKDVFRIKGIRSTFGALPQYHFHIPTNDCILIERLRDAGAIIIGRTNVPLLSFDWQCRNILFNECSNPWDNKRTSGGSSGGAAAALASGFTPLELGSDLGGSILYPAHCCGILGLRTSEGLLPITDIGPENLDSSFKHLVVAGPMARSITDLQLMLEILSAQTPAGINIQTQTKLKIAYSASILNLEVDSDTKTAHMEFCNSLKNDGHDIVETFPSEIDFNKCYELHGTIAGHELKQMLPRFFQTYLGKKLFRSYFFYLKMGNGPFTKWFKTGFDASEMQYQDALEERNRMSDKIERFFEQFDIWLTPVSPTVAIKRQRWGFSIRYKNKHLPYSEFLGSFVVPTAILKIPALSFPIAHTSGMPIGIKAMSKRNSDFQLLDIAEKFFEKYIDVRIARNF